MFYFFSIVSISVTACMKREPSLISLVVTDYPVLKFISCRLQFFIKLACVMTLVFICYCRFLPAKRRKVFMMCQKVNL